MNNNDRKTIWIIDQYASTPEMGRGGRQYYLAKELAKQGHNVYLIAAGFTHLLRKAPKLKEQFTIQNLNDNFKFVWIKMPNYRDAHDKKRVWNWIKFTIRISKLPKIIVEPPDAILVSSPAPFMFLSAHRLAVKYNAILAFDVRDIWPLTLVELGGYSRNHPFIQLMQWVEDKAYKDSDLVLSNLPNAVEHMIERGMNPKKFNWIPNGFDKNELENIQPLDSEIMSKLPKEKFIVGYTGTLGFANALDSLVEAAYILQSKSDIVFVIVGQGKEKKNLIDKARSLNNVVFIESIPKQQVQSMLSEFDVCYIGLTKDPLFRFGVSPNKLFDYFLSKRPIIYAIESGNYLPVEEAEAGISIGAEDPKAISEAILKLKKLKPEERMRMGENGRAYALSNHNYESLALKINDLIYNSSIN